MWYNGRHFVLQDDHIFMYVYEADLLKSMKNWKISNVYPHILYRHVLKRKKNISKKKKEQMYCNHSKQTPHCPKPYIDF